MISATMNCNFNPTITVLASILPYAATTYDRILIAVEGQIAMVGCGLTKTYTVFQFMKPELNNIFLGFI